MMRPTLGADGPTVSRLGLGCMSMTGSYGRTDPHEAAATLREALDSGVTMFDTGDFYGDGANEELLGRALTPHRDRVVLATKTGVHRTAEGLVPAGSPNDLRRAREASLRRLRTDHIDRPHLRDNLAALDLHLTATDLRAIDAAVPDTGAQGARYGDHDLALIDQ